MKFWQLILAAILGAVVAPRLIGAIMQKSGAPFFEPPTAADFLLVPMILGGLIVFVLPVAQLVNRQESKLILVAVPTISGLIGGSFLALVVILLASSGAALQRSDLLSTIAIFGGLPGMSSAFVWSLLNLANSARHA